MTYGEEIETVKRQFGETERAVEVRDALTEKLAKLKAAEAAEREARERAEEARAATDALREAEAEHRRAQAAPLAAELHAMATSCARSSAKFKTCCWTLVRHEARALHARREAIVAKHNAVAAAPLGAPRVPRVHPETLGEFVRRGMRKFNGPMDASHTSARERQLDRERAADEGRA